MARAVGGKRSPFDRLMRDMRNEVKRLATAEHRAIARELLKGSMKTAYLASIRPANYSVANDTAVLRLEVGDPGMDRDDPQLLARIAEEGHRAFDMRESYGIYENPDLYYVLMLKEPTHPQPVTLSMNSTSPWIHPAAEGHHIMKEVKKKMADLHTKALAAALKKNKMDHD